MVYFLGYTNVTHTHVFTLQIKKEVAIHKMLNHDNVIKYFGTRKELDHQYIFLAYASGGELFDRIEPDVGMPQQQAQNFFRQLIEGWHLVLFK